MDGGRGAYGRLATPGAAWTAVVSFSFCLGGSHGSPRAGDESGRGGAVSTAGRSVVDRDELAARRSLRAQVAKLERELSDAFVTAFPIGGLDDGRSRRRYARMLDLGELERVRDELAERLESARVTIAERAEVQAANRVLPGADVAGAGQASLRADRLQRPRRARLRRVAGAAEARPDRDADGLVAGQALLRLSVTRGRVAVRDRGPDGRPRTLSRDARSAEDRAWERCWSS